MTKFSNIKNITVEYYNVCSFRNCEGMNNTATTDIIEISALLKELQEASIQKRTINYNGENLILSNIFYNNVSKLWELVFFKSRSATIPFIVNSQGISRQIMLENDEMISEVLCVEYNPKTKVLAMQRNIYAFGAKGLETFLSHFVTYPLFLQSIQTLNEEKKSLLKRSKLKKFRLHVKNSVAKTNANDFSNSIVQYKKNTSICKVIDSALAINSSIIDIEFSVANSSQIIEIKDEDFEVFQDLMNNSNVKCLELGLAPDEYSTMQITDFMDFRVQDVISVPFTKGQPIDISEILKKMAEKFRKNMYL